jgi:hypothetical protein
MTCPKMLNAYYMVQCRSQEVQERLGNAMGPLEFSISSTKCRGN